jgi:hypothetical protein
MRTTLCLWDAVGQLCTWRDWVNACGKYSEAWRTLCAAYVLYRSHPRSQLLVPWMAAVATAFEKRWLPPHQRVHFPA